MINKAFKYIGYGVGGILGIFLAKKILSMIFKG